LIGADRCGLLFRHLKIAKLACHIRRPRYPERGRNSGKVPIADDLFESYPARLQTFNQNRNLAADSLQVQRTAKITTTDDCSEARPLPAAALLSASDIGVSRRDANTGSCRPVPRRLGSRALDREETSW
jgi:hypothetical protein